MSLKKLNTKTITLSAMLGALSAILMVFELRVPLAPSFVAFDFSDLPIIIGGLAYGPILAIFITVIKILLNLVLNGTVTMFVGEFANLLLTLLYVLPASIIYARHRDKKTAIQGLVIATCFVSVMAILVNVFINFPLYAKMFSMSMDDIVQMATMTNPWVHDLTSMIIFSLFPFNMFKYGIISLLTILSYKKLSRLLK